MYDLTFNKTTLSDMLDHRSDGRQIYCAITVPYSGIFTDKSEGSSVSLPYIVCPYQVNDILAIQEQWAREGNNYVYAADYDYGSSYNFRAASTMPVSAARMYARIVSIRTWSVTQDIADNYLSIGTTSDTYAGTAKVIGYYDRGNELLSNIRKNYNKEVLDKTSQPNITTNFPKVVKYVPYYLRQPINYNYIDTQGRSKEGVKSPYVQAYDGSQVKRNGSLVPIDEYHRAWSKEERKTRVTDSSLEFAGESSWSTEENPSYIYFRLNSDGFRQPVWAQYKASIVDPDQHMFVWLISAYLCDKEGKIIGNWFGKQEDE